MSLHAAIPLNPVPDDFAGDADVRAGGRTFHDNGCIWPDDAHCSQIGCDRINKT